MRVSNIAKNALVAGGLVVALVVAFALGNPKAVSAEETGQRLISVTGEARIEVKPDMATLNFGVENTAKTAQDAQRENALSMNAVIDALFGMGIAKEDIQTSNFGLYPVYEWEGDRPDTSKVQVLTGYRCNNTVTVRLKDIGTVGAAIDKAVTAGATNVGGISFGLQNPNAHQTAMLTSAVKDAESKAQIMARAAGVTITGVYRISDGYTSVESVRSAAGYKLAMDAAPSIEPGSVTVRATVRVDYSF